MKSMFKQLLFILILLPCVAFGQQTEKYVSDYTTFYRAEELYEKAQFSAAREEFRAFVNQFKNENDPLYIKALYYEGMSALELFNNDAIPLLQSFNKKYPENIYKYVIGFEIGNYFFQKEDFINAQVWYQKVPVNEVDKAQQEEFLFKLGYSAMQNADNESAFSAFRDAKDGKSQYAAPSLYFYSHLSYLKNSLSVALEGFLKLKSDSTFSAVVPYYIVQIYHKQAKFQEVVDFAPSVLNATELNNEADINHIIGNSHYKLGNFKEAIPYLEKYQTKSKVTRDDAYELGYCYHKANQSEKAIKQWDKVTRVEDSLGQIAMYQIGEAYLVIDKLLPARSAFERASEMKTIPLIQEDALYNFAVISFKVDINPYDESVRAFENYLNRYPNSSRKKDVYQYLVNVYTNTSNFAKALESLDNLPVKDAQLKKVYQSVAFNYGVEMFQKNNLPGALDAFKLVDKYPIDPQMVALSRYWIADIHFRNNEVEKSLSIYREFLGSPASNSLKEKVDAYYNMGYAYFQLNDIEEAVKSFRIYLQSAPTNQAKIADATFRVADGYYSTKQNLLAIEFYKEALKLNTPLNDKALYYLAKSYGYDRQADEKINTLKELISKHKKSKYVMNSTYDLARSYVEKAMYDEALSLYKSFVLDFPNASYLLDVKLSIADLYYKKWDYTKAELEYTKILAENEKVREICEKAVKGLFDVYTTQKLPEKAADLADRYECANISKDEKENIFFSPAWASYQDSNYVEAAPKFELYLSKFPEGRFVNEIYYYLGHSYFRIKDTTKAVANFEKFLETPVNAFSEYAAARTAAYHYNKKDYAKAYKYYEKQEQLGSKPAFIFNARLGLMRCAFLTDDFTKAAIYAKFIIETPSITNQQRIEAEYAKGMSNYNLSNYTEAKSSLEWLVKNTTTAMGAEAKYTLASINFKQAEYGKADSEIKALVKMKPSYNFWVAKGLILQTRIHIINDDLFQAESTLKSVISFYPDQNDGVLTEANDLWDELMQLKNPPAIEGPKEEKKIEINGE